MSPKKVLAAIVAVLPLCAAAASASAEPAPDVRSGVQAVNRIDLWVPPAHARIPVHVPPRSVSPTSAPEVDLRTSGAALTLLIGGALVLRGRRARRSH